MADFAGETRSRLKALHERVWEGRASGTEVDEWLDNFNPSSDKDKLHALYLLSNFMYFGAQLTKELLKSLYRDLFKYPLVEQIRRANGDTADLDVINAAFDEELLQTYFLGVGNPSESGCHLLYFFRQENGISKDRFIHTHQIFSRGPGGTPVTLRDPNAKRYVFIDDFCGSGDQGIAYSRDVVDEIKTVDPAVSTAYYMLFATEEGKDRVKNETNFDSVECIVELDSSFKCFGANSRFFDDTNPTIQKDHCRQLCESFGALLWPDYPLGYQDCQLLIGFHHNTPDNTLPVIWFDEPDLYRWSPIFRRYPKIY